MKLNAIPIKSSQLISRTLDDGTVIVSPSDGQISVVNDVGSSVWCLIDGQRSVAAIAKQITILFNVTLDRAQEDTFIFLASLEERELISWKQNARSEG